LRISHERLDIGRGNTVYGAPDIVVEILSPSNRNYDEVEKARLYENAGVLEYWILDPITRQFQLLTLAEGAYVPISPESRILRSTVVPGLVVDPAALFASLDSDRTRSRSRFDDPL